MMISYHSLTDLEKSLLENESRTESEITLPSPQIRHYICFTNVKYIFYLLFILMLLLFLIFIAILITNYTVEP